MNTLPECWSQMNAKTGHRARCGKEKFAGLPPHHNQSTTEERPRRLPDGWHHRRGKSHSDHSPRNHSRHCLIRNYKNERMIHWLTIAHSNFQNISIVYSLPKWFNTNRVYIIFSSTRIGVLHVSHGFLSDFLPLLLACPFGIRTATH